MTTTTTTTLRCDGCTGGQSVLTLSWSSDGPPIGKRGWKLAKTVAAAGWKQFRTSSKGPRRDFCPECLKAGRAK